MSLRSASEALTELVAMTAGELSHVWVEWQGLPWIFTTFDGGRSGMISTEAQLRFAQTGAPDADPAAAMVLLDGRIAARGAIVGTRDDIKLTGRKWP